MKKAPHPLATLPLKAVMKKPEILGLENIEAGVPAIFVSNHLGYYAPLKIFVFADVNLLPWVRYEIADKALCKDYLKADFVEPQLRLKGRFGDAVAGAISPICTGIMKRLGAIPVYAGSRKIIDTVEQSAIRLEMGYNLLIFPEAPAQPLNDFLCKFNAGFVNVAKVYYERFDKIVPFYPVCVNKKKNTIRFSKKITFDPRADFGAEKRRIVNALIVAIIDMYGSGKMVDPDSMDL